MNDQTKTEHKNEAHISPSELNAGLDGYYTDFCCPNCGSYMFGSSRNKDGSLTRRCHGNEQWKCDYEAHQDKDHIHFKTLVSNVKVSSAP